MIRLRYWQRSDLPWIQAGAAATAWDYLSPEEQRSTTRQQAVSGAMQGVSELAKSPVGLGLVAEVGGERAGYLLISLVPHPFSHQFEAHFIDIFVDPRFRRQGIARRLSQAAEAEVARHGIGAIKLFMQGDNRASKENARGLGYRKTGEVWAKVPEALAATGGYPQSGAYYG